MIIEDTKISLEDIPDNEEVFVGVGIDCEFIKKFKEKTKSNTFDGLIFLSTTDLGLGYVKTDDFFDHVIKVSDKSINMDYYSSGIYYFKTGFLLKKYLRKNSEENFILIFNLMINDGLIILKSF